MDEPQDRDAPVVGWIGAGRMGTEMALRLLAAGFGVEAWNRTRERLGALSDAGATLADEPSGLARHDVVFVIVADGDALEQVLFGAGGLLTGAGPPPPVVVECSTVGVPESAALRERAGERGTALLAAPVSGNPSVVRDGDLSFACSGEREAFERAEPLLRAIGRSATYMGAGEQARVAKLCHNLILGVMTQALSEVLVLGQSAGIGRAELMRFLNSSVVGSRFSAYKSPALVGLDMTPSFTPRLLRKDFGLGFELADDAAVPMPVAAATREAIQASIGEATERSDFAVLLLRQAEAAGIELVPEDPARALP